MRIASLGLKGNQLTPDPTSFGNSIIIPLTLNNQNLSALLVVTQAEDYTYSITCTTQEMLRQHVYNTDAEVSQIEQRLALFIYFENKIWGTNTFYHIPSNLFGGIDVHEGTNQKEKTLKLADISQPSESNYVFCVQIHFICSICGLMSCPLSWTVTVFADMRKTQTPVEAEEVAEEVAAEEVEVVAEVAEVDAHFT
ncbi:MAG: hypothetical protein WAU23_14180 [Ferruginibacter sp.]